MVGERKDTYFWEDHWVVEWSLCSLFPLLYHLDFLVWSGSSCSFSFGFRCVLSNRETTEMTALFSLLEGHLLCVREEK